MIIKLYMLFLIGICFTSSVLATKAAISENNEAFQERLATLEATVLNQARVQANLEFLLLKQSERLEETEMMLRQQKDVNTVLMNRQMAADERQREAALINEQLQQKLISLENVTDECKRFALASDAGQAAITRGARQAFVETVAFTAYLDHNLEHLGIDHPIVYNQVLLNEGAAYHSSNGMFTCPDDGFYVFYFQVASFGTGHQVVAKLVVEGVNQVDGISDTFHQYHEAQGGNMAILQLKRGQTVWVANYRHIDQSTQTSDAYRFATFSGFRIY